MIDIEYIVYKYTFPNDKIYIGISSRTLEQRWNIGYRHSPRVFNAIKKYGKQNIKREILFDKLSKNDAEKIEHELIMNTQSYTKEYGYNIELGGKSADRLTEKTKKRISEKLTGITRSDETKKSMAIAQKKNWENKSQTEKDDVIKRLKEINIGREPWNKGKKGLQNHTEEWKREASVRAKTISEKNKKK